MSRGDENADFAVAVIAFIILAVALCASCHNPPAPVDTTPHPPASRDANTVVFLGDSITARWSTLGADVAPRVAINAGISGQTSEQIAARVIPDVVNSTAAAMVILAGTNDILGSLSVDPSYVESAAMQAREYGIRVIVCTIPETTHGQGNSTARVDEWNAALTAWARDNSVTVADYSAVITPADLVDGIHPNAAGYAAMAIVINDAFSAP